MKIAIAVFSIAMLSATAPAFGQLGVALGAATDQWNRDRDRANEREMFDRQIKLQEQIQAQTMQLEQQRVEMENRRREFELQQQREAMEKRQKLEAFKALLARIVDQHGDLGREAIKKYQNTHGSIVQYLDYI